MNRQNNLKHKFYDIQTHVNSFTECARIPFELANINNKQKVKAHDNGKNR